ncbi:hypothetical protein FH063_005066 [Azospirillum argentinense]|uniref:Uncharacterized protein n=1 Tax=Azospirillum argentinense TaxID=2970906 RepID=A0A5B0KVR6_9PROT|nr:hypothetical protein FH063_005066 [Azospirillum argentinense]
MNGADRCLPHNFAGGGPAWILYGGIGGPDASAGCPRAGSEPRLPAAPVLTTREGFLGNADIRMDRFPSPEETRALAGISRRTVEMFRFFNQFWCHS